MSLENQLREMLELTAKKRDFEAQIMALDSEIVVLEAEILDAIKRASIMPPFKAISGRYQATISLRKNTFWGAAKEGDWQGVKAGLEQAGWHDLIRPQSQALNGRLNDYEKDDELTIPECVAAVVKKSERHSIVVNRIKVTEGEQVEFAL